MKKTMVFLFILMTFLISAEISFAEGRNGYGSDGGRYYRKMEKRSHGGGIFASLNLSKEQEEKLLKVKKEQKMNNFKIKSELEYLRNKMKMAFMEDSLDEKGAKKMSKEIGQLTTKRLNVKIDFMSKLREILTKEQLAKINLNMMFNNDGKRVKKRRRSKSQ